jgi:hypothetical protein
MQRHFPFEAMTPHASLVAVRKIFRTGEHSGPVGTVDHPPLRGLRKFLIQDFR